MRTCRECGETKPIAEYHLKLGRPRVICRSCANVKRRAWWAKNKGKPGFREKRTEDKVRRQFGVTPEQYAAMLDAQGGTCAICGRPPGKRRLAVDHDHDTGRVRGLLCVTCNAALAWIEGEWSDKLIAYLIHM